MEQEEVYITLPELAELTAISIRALRKYIAQGRLIPLKGYTTQVGKRKKRRCYLFKPEHYQIALSLRTGLHWRDPATH